MQILSEGFTSLTIIGLWLPINCDRNTLAGRAYRLYSTIVIFSLEMMLVSLIAASILYTDNMDDLAEASYVTLTAFNASIKCANFIYRRNRFVNLINMLLEKPCLPRDEEEIKIYSDYNRLARYVTFTGTTVGYSAASFMSIITYFFFEGENSLTLLAWYPYEIQNGLTYWFSYLHQSISLITMAGWNGSNDVVISGFMIQICSQLELLTHRLKNLPDNVRMVTSEKTSLIQIREYEREIIKQSVKHHLHIIKLAEEVKSTFAPTILSQYCLSTFIMCITVYKLTDPQSDLAKLACTFMYLGAMLCELVLYCWFGNEVILKSLEFNETVCKGDWTELHVDTLKSLLIMMLRSSKSISVTCGPLIVLSNDSLIGILKLSYSAFNVLRKSN